MRSFIPRAPRMFHFILGLAVTLSLAACGGGSDPVDAAGDAGAKSVVRSADAKATAAAATDSWVACAQENQTCSFSGAATVRYGAGTSYATGSYTNSVLCSNTVFGDPVFGVVKSCSYQLVVTAPTTPTPPTPPTTPTAPPTTTTTTWTLCAQENQTCSFSGTLPVRYGTATQNVTATYTNQVACANTVFGDPAPGIVKSCWYGTTTTTTAPTTPTPPAAPTTTWVFCANESQLCAFSGTTTVRYGAGTSFATGTYTNGVTCSNTIFGDPAFGVVKSCSYQVTVPANPSAPVATITVQPQSLTLRNGQSGTFAVTATSTTAITYQWSRNGVAIAGATGASYSIPAVQLADSGAAFRVAVANAGGTVTSNTAGLTVNAATSTGATAQRLFSDQSLWNARPTQFTLGSERIPTSTYFPAIGTGPYSVAAAIASNTDPAVTVLPAPSSGLYVPDAEVYVSNIVIPHWPANVVPATGDDGHADIIDVAANRIHSFYQLTHGSDGIWRAAQYTWSALDGTGWGTPAQYVQGARATGVLPSAGLIRINEVNDGQPVYQHALAMSLTFNGLSGSPGSVFPATASDWNAATTNTGAIPEGARMMLPAGFDTSAITSPALLKIVQTLKTYGAYVVDRNGGTPYSIYVENGADFNLMPNGWDDAIAAQLQAIRAALAPLRSVTQWVDATGTVFTPNTNLNLLSMRGYWYTDTGPLGGTFDSWQQAVVFPSNGVLTSQINVAGRSIPSFVAATPAVGTRFELHVTASGGATLRLTIDKAGASFDSGVLGDGGEVVLTWPSGAAGAAASVRVTSGPQGGGKVSATLVQLAN